MDFWDWFYKVIILQCICVSLIISSVVVIKYFYKGEFLKVQNFYENCIIADTDVNEVLK